MKILYLTIKSEFFEEIAAGEKPYEYREQKEYWRKRLEGKHFDQVLFRKGYQKDAPTMRVEIRGISTTIFKGKPHYKIILGRILEVHNYAGKVVEGYFPT